MNFRNLINSIFRTGNYFEKTNKHNSSSEVSDINQAHPLENKSSLKTNNMAMFNYEVGGNEVKVDANEAINEIQANKTILVSQLTEEEPIQPETVEGLKTLEDVFRHFKPSITIEMQNADGESIKEQLRFAKLDDFTPKGITRQSAFLNSLKIQQEQYTKIMKQLKSNKVLQTMLANPDTKDAIINALKQVTSELESSVA
jgi:hypothetical protein